MILIALSKGRKRMRLIFRFFYLLVLFAFVLTNVWAGAALWIDLDTNYAHILSLLALAACVSSFLFLRPSLIKLVLHAGLTGLVLLWWTQLPASKDREWEAEYAQLPRAELSGSKVTFHNVRNFHYGSDGNVQENWETRTYDLDQLVGLDMFFSHWSSPHIAHTLVSWQFESGPPLIISIETRRELGEEYSALLGFFKQFELYYVVTDERDVVRLRTNIREEDVYLYRMPATVPFAKQVLLKYIEHVNKLNERAAWYNAATHNCTTTIRHNVDEVTGRKPWTWQLFLNGHLPELWFKQGRFKGLKSLQELQERSYVTDIGKAAGDREDYSEIIRQKIPPRASAVLQ